MLTASLPCTRVQAGSSAGGLLSGCVRLTQRSTHPRLPVPTQPCPQFCRTSNEMAANKSWKFDVDARHLLTLNGMAFDPTQDAMFKVDGSAIPCNVL